MTSKKQSQDRERWSLQECGSNFKVKISRTDWLVGAVVQDIASGAGSVGSISRPAKSETVSPKASHRCDVSSELRCLALSRRNEPCHLLHAATRYHEYDEDLI